MSTKWLILDAMGVIYSIGDDVADLLVPFILRRNPNASHDGIEQAYLAASLGTISSVEFWEHAGLGDDYPEVEVEYLDSQLKLNDGFLAAAELLAARYDLAMLSNDVADWSRHLRSRFDLAMRTIGHPPSADSQTCHRS